MLLTGVVKSIIDGKLMIVELKGGKQIFLPAGDEASSCNEFGVGETVEIEVY